MKRPLLILFTLSVAFFACKKSSSDPNAGKTYITANLNGVATNFVGGITVDTTNGEIYIDAYKDSVGGNSTALTLIMDGGLNPVVAGVYPLDPTDDFKSGTVGYRYIGSSGGVSSEEVYGQTSDTVTVSAISKSSVTGTFSAKLYHRTLDLNTMQQVVDSVITITNGKFNVPLQ